MSKTKDMVIDDQNRKNEQFENRRRDINRLSKETNYQLFSALTEAMRQVAGDRKAGEAICDSELYCDMFSLQAATFARVVKHDRKLQQYQHMEMDQLLKELYQRMKMFHHIVVEEGAGLPGIKWHMEQNGVFAIDLKECALNMEHSFEDPDAEYRDKQKEGRLFCIGLNLPLLDSEDPEAKDSHLWNEYDEFLTFCCEFDNDKECRDIYPCEYSHERAILDTLAQLDVIKNMNEQNENK